MIERYNCNEISDIWSEHNKFKTFLEVELALTEALEGKVIPAGISQTIREKAKIDPDRIKEIEKETKHDVIAFCSSITENLPKDISKYFHFGCTSSDIIDTATSLQIKRSVQLIQKQLKRLTQSLMKRAEETKHTICMGRSHGMNAEPMSFANKFLSFYCEFSRRLDDINNFLDKEITGQLSGAVGNYTVITPEIEKDALSKLKLNTEPVSSQIIPRDRIMKLITLTSMIASAVERVSVEIRHLHHSDLGEVFEGFSKGQKGSSTMPHKKNPISAENLTGISRVIRSHLSIAIENNVLWHERDISHSSAERMMLPDNLGLTFYALRRLTNTIENLVINTDKIQSKVFDNFSYLSSYILHKLINENDGSREELYAVVQSASFNAKTTQEFIEEIKSSKLCKESELNHLMTIEETTIRNIYLNHINAIFDRVKEKYSQSIR